LKRPLKATIIPIVKKYSGGHFFSSGIEKQVAQDFVDSIKK